MSTYSGITKKEDWQDLKKRAAQARDLKPMTRRDPFKLAADASVLGFGKLEQDEVKIA